MGKRETGRRLRARHIVAAAGILGVGLAGLALTGSMTAPVALAQSGTAGQDKPFSVQEHYTKYEYRIAMRDGVDLFTVVYVPKDQSKTYPFLMVRTPYGSGARVGRESLYGAESYPKQLGPSPDFDRAGYIFVFQDVRGRFMSGGKWMETRPHIDDKKSKNDVDDSSDMHDSVDWLLKNVPGNNGKVGIWGISYPGFFTSASIVDSHPAIKAASPQAPVTDLYLGDDAYHGGAYMLAANFAFYAAFKAQKNPTPEPRGWSDYDFGTADGYDFYLKQGNLDQMGDLLANGDPVGWHEMVDHPTYDDYWKPRAIAPHLKNIKAAVLTVGGWFDAEDLHGPFTTYNAIEAQNPGTPNNLVIGPWVHGGWARTYGHKLGAVDFAADTGDYYRKNILFPFFEQHLKGAPDAKLAKATVFETGTNVWRQYPSWPPKQAQTRTLYLLPDGGLGWTAPATAPAKFDEYISDPAHPVPYVGYVTTDVPKEYMVADQRFATTRPDVLVYQTAPLENDVTLVGPVSPKLFVSTSGTDSDWVVKLIDVYPDELPPVPGGEGASDPKADVPPPSVDMEGYQQLVRGDPLRGKFRNGFEKPEPMVPDQVTPIRYALADINHTFRRSHRIMVQIQSSWFPLVDRNPQTFVNIPQAKPEDFKAARERIYRSPDYPSGLEVHVMPAPGTP
ncbi:MAG: CocE/NonD family hydrolase [Azospirillaceae bacterium]|nr:CocE/NonD family hydrolase [Azospirillaceae bacterium]